MLFRTKGYVPTRYSPVCRSRIATGARLACIKPAASVRSEPGSNSQVGLKTLNRLITRLDEVPPLLAAHDSHRIRPWCNLYKRVRRSLSSDRTSQKACAFEDGAVRKDSAAHVSLSSIQFSNSPEPKPHIHSATSVSGTCTLIRRQFATDDWPAAKSLISMRSFSDRTARQCQRPWRRPVDGWVIGPPFDACQRQSQQIVARPSSRCDQPGSG